MSSPFVSSPPMLIEGGPSPSGWSRIGTILFCLQLYARKYLGGDKKARAPSPEQAAGTAIHTGIAHTYARRGAAHVEGVTAAGHHYTAPSQLLAPNDAIVAEVASIREETGGEIKVDADNAIRCVEAHFDFYRETWRVLHVEDVYTAALPDPERVWTPERIASAQRLGLFYARDAVVGQPIVYAYTGRADLVVESGGKTRIVDHKSHGEGKHAAQAAKEYGMSGQIIGWRWMGSKVYGDRFGGVLLNLVGRDAPYRFARPEMDIPDARIRWFEQTVIDAERRAADMGDRPLDAYTPQLSGAEGCVGRFGGCKVLHTCQHGSS